MPTAEKLCVRVQLLTAYAAKEPTSATHLELGFVLLATAADHSLAIVRGPYCTFLEPSGFATSQIAPHKACDETRILHGHKLIE
jgi:hypothetical protein